MHKKVITCDTLQMIISADGFSGISSLLISSLITVKLMMTKTKVWIKYALKRRKLS